MSTPPTTYFGYGSNLWKHQMVKRCPTSEYLGVARLSGYRWIINERGYANVVEMAGNKTEGETKDVVWGLVYKLQREDEQGLDKNEGVPYAYTKENLAVSYWPSQPDGAAPNITHKPVEMDMLVYIDRNKTTPDEPKEEYIYRMNMGVQDALKEGVPKEYVNDVMREFIPEEEDEEVDEETVRFAGKQAVMFEEED